ARPDEDVDRALLHALDNTLLRADVRLPRGDGRVPLDAAWEDEEGAFVVSTDARPLAHTARTDARALRLVLQLRLSLRLRAGHLGDRLEHDRARGAGLPARARDSRIRPRDDLPTQPSRQ